MTKPAFLHIFCGLLIFTSFSILTITLRGYQISIAYCLFFIQSRVTGPVLENV